MSPLLAVVLAASLSTRPLTDHERACRAALDDTIAIAEHLEIDLAEARADRDALHAQLVELATQPPPEPEAPYWVPYVVAGAAVAGAILGAAGTIALADAL